MSWMMIVGATLAATAQTACLVDAMSVQRRVERAPGKVPLELRTLPYTVAPAIVALYTNRPGLYVALSGVAVYVYVRRLRPEIDAPPGIVANTWSLIRQLAQSGR